MLEDVPTGSQLQSCRQMSGDHHPYESISFDPPET